MYSEVQWLKDSRELQQENFKEGVYNAWIT